jgi:hypothetical protein
MIVISVDILFSLRQRHRFSESQLPVQALGWRSKSNMDAAVYCPTWAPFFGFAGVFSAVSLDSNFALNGYDGL